MNDKAIISFFVLHRHTLLFCDVFIATRSTLAILGTKYTFLFLIFRNEDFRGTSQSLRRRRHLVVLFPIAGDPIIDTAKTCHQSLQADLTIYGGHFRGIVSCDASTTEENVHFFKGETFRFGYDEVNEKEAYRVGAFGQTLYKKLVWRLKKLRAEVKEGAHARRFDDGDTYLP